MEDPAPSRSHAPGRGPVRLFLIFALVAVAIVWPLVNVGPRGATILMFSPQHGVDVGRNAAVRKAIVDKNVRIDPGARIGFDAVADRARFTVSDAGIVVVPKGAHVSA